MGSLPNLHELGKENAGANFKAPAALGNLCGGQGGYVLSEHERNKILHRHNKVGKTRSYGCEPNKIIIDDSTLEHMAGYSPISNRSVRQFHQIRRKDSLSSSIGATSVRRLLAVVRNGPSHRQRVHRTSEPSKHNLIVNLILLCVSHLTITATYLPYLALQSSLSVWSKSDELFTLDISVGSLFLGLSHVLASIVCLLTLPFNQRFGSNILLAVSYLLMTVHFIMNLHPVLYLMLPSSVIFGIALGLTVNAQITCLMTIAIKLSNVYRMVEEDEEIKNIRYTCLIRRTARAFRGAHDFGLILGSIVSTLIISWTLGSTSSSTDIVANTTELICLQTSVSNSTSNCSATTVEQISTTYEYNSFLDDIFDTVEGTRLCGSQACPLAYPLSFNESLPSQYSSALPLGSAQALTGFYAFLCAAATALIVVGMDTLNLYAHAHPDSSHRPGLMASLRSVREVLRDSRIKLLSPTMFFIGLEQAFIYSDFGKSYVVCTLGIHRLNLVYLAMGSLQSIAACTLSMLLRSIRRYYIVGVGFIFHSCLMLVLILWKPIEDDPALFFVISAAWGVCNAIWEMLGFTLLTCQFATDRWEVAFAVTSFYRLLGIGVAFLFHGYVCNYVKLYGLTFFMVAAVVTFTYLDVRLENTKKLKNISRL